MAGDNQRAAFGRQTQQNLAHFDPSFRIQSVGGFVQNQNFRVMQQCAGDANSLLHAVAEAFHKTILHPGGVGQFQNLGNPLAACLAGDTKCCSKEIQIFAHPHVVVRTELVGHIADQFADLVDVFHTVDAGNGGRTGRRF